MFEKDHPQISKGTSGSNVTRPPTMAAYWFIVVVKICPQSHWKVSRSDWGESECGPVSLPTSAFCEGTQDSGFRDAVVKGLAVVARALPA
jgi:hypothetical protein